MRTMAKKTAFKVGRDAGTGEFITVEKAKKNPNTAVVETITVSKPKAKK